MNIKKLILSGAFRQLVSGLALVLGLILAAKQISIEDFAAYNYEMLVIYTGGAVLGVLGYPLIYKYLSENNAKNLYLPLIIILVNLIISGFIGFLLYYFGIFKSQYSIIGICLFICANCITAISLGISKYILYNLGEVLPSLTLLLSVLFLGINNYNKLLLFTFFGFFLKILIYILIFKIDSEIYIKKYKIISLSFIKDGLLVGCTGALQNFFFRFSFLLGMASGLNFSTLFTAIYPFVEKVLVFPQAANSILYGKIVKNEIPKLTFLKLISLIMLFCIVSSIFIYLLIRILEIYYFDSSYKGISKISIFVCFLFVLQGLRILIHNFFQGVSNSIIVLKDSIILGLLCAILYILKIEDFAFIIAIYFVFFLLSLIYLIRRFNRFQDV